MNRYRYFVAKVLICSAWAIMASGQAWAADTKGPSRSDCGNYNLPFDERLVRSCDAQYGLCAKPTTTWSANPRLVRTCAQIAREKQLSAALPGTPGRTDVVAPRLLGKQAPTAPSNGRDLAPALLPGAVSR